MLFRTVLICLLWLLVLASPCHVWGQAGSFSIEGTVTDPRGAVIAGATVLLMETNGVASTDVSGKFSFQGLDAGRYTLRASSRDFETEQLLVEAGATGAATPELRMRRIKAAMAAVEVVGESAEALLETPGSLFVLSRAELQNSHPMDANEVLRRVPGVVINDNSGPVSLRLNIGVRGLNPDRSRSVLMLEDGLPLTIAPYGEPEAYYSPAIDRMDRVEVVKGSGQVLYGPQTVGGVVNFITPDPPSQTRAELNLQGGQRGFFAGNGLIGGSSEDQRMGWLVNFLHKRGDGFRDFFFNVDDLQTKFVLKPSDSQTFTVRAGYYDENSNSTYLGLTTPMYLDNPNQNPVPSDFLKVKRVSASRGTQQRSAPPRL